MKRIFLSLALMLPLAVAAQTQSGLWVPVPAAAQSRPIVIQGATVHVGDGRVLERTDVVCVGGKITQVGSGLTAPADALVVNGAGKHLYPGLISLASQLGLVEIEAVRQTDDTGETGDYNPNVRAIVSYNTDSHVIPVVRSNGILIAQSTPTGGVVMGQSAVVQLDAWNYEDAALVADDALHIAWPVTRARFGGAPPAADAKDPTLEAIKALDKVFDEAAAYAAARAAGTAVQVDLRLEAMRPYVQAERPVFFHAEATTAIEQSVAFGLRHKLRTVIHGGADSWRVTALLAQHKVPVVLQNSHSLPSRIDEDVDQAFKTAKLLKDAGVSFCLGGEAGGHWRSQNLPFHAGSLAAYGLSAEEALRAVTLDAARVVGLDGRLGSIEVGKDATLVLSRGDLLDMRTNAVELALISGRNVDLSNKQKALYHRFQQKYGEK